MKEKNSSLLCKYRNIGRREKTFAERIQGYDILPPAFGQYLMFGLKLLKIHVLKTWYEKKTVVIGQRNQ